jgi:hypothetical protein
MTEHTEQTPAQPSAVPARIDLEDFIEAVTRGVARALAAQDEVSGYALNLQRAQAQPGLTPQWPPPGLIVGIIAAPPTIAVRPPDTAIAGS